MFTITFCHKEMFAEINALISMDHNKRSDYSVWLLGDCYTEDSDDYGVLKYFHYNKQLPSNRQVLKHIYFLKKEF